MQKDLDFLENSLKYQNMKQLTGGLPDKIEPINNFPYQVPL